MKFFNTLLYGSRKAKQCILTIIVLIIAFLGLLATSVAVSSLSLGVVAIFVLLIDLLYASSISWKDLERQEKKNLERKKKIEKARKKETGKEDSLKTADPDASVKLYKGENIKELLYRYKVKKKHKAILVDRYQKYQIRQCPAFIWIEKGMLRFLFLTEEPLKIGIPLKEVSKISYIPNVEANPMEDYREVFDSKLLSMIFSSYLPSQFMVEKMGRRVMCKNLYELANGIRITNLSVKELFSLLPLQLEVQDPFMQSSQIDAYSKEAYRCWLLWKDGILEMEAYKAEISRILKGMMQTGMPQTTFQHNIQNMVQRRFITKEFADYYIERYKE
ncbi:MAG: hypothetical protein PUB10_01550 [Clostridiales bacterium]|nr:hypothetical protein [Clostridiales bacterium]